MTWDYELANRIKDRGQGNQAPCLEGEVVSAAPLIVSLYDGEVMAPPAPLKVVESAPGYTVSGYVIQKLPWRVGDRVVCAWMGRALVVLGRLN